MRLNHPGGPPAGQKPISGNLKPEAIEEKIAHAIVKLSNRVFIMWKRLHRENLIENYIVFSRCIQFSSIINTPDNKPLKP